MATPSAVIIRASTIARLHTTLSFVAFLSALFLGCALHYKKIVKNGVAGWPEEWFPSVSATIGDWYPERNLFQFFIAVNSGPRFAVLLFSYFLSRKLYPTRSAILLCIGVVRTLSCGGWVFVTSSDDHDVHDFLMILYIVCNLPWMWGGLYAGGRRAIRWRVLFASAFWLSLIPMIYFFIEHKVHRKPGAYTYYAFFEWSLIFLDVLYDSTTISQFEESGFQAIIGLPSTDSSLGEKAEAHELSTTNNESESSKIPSKPAAAEAKTVVEPSNSLFSALNHTRPVLSFLSDVYFAYQSWTLLTALPTTLFYFSVWKLALAGPEFSTFATLSPFLLGIPFIYEGARTHNGRHTLSSIACGVGLGLWGVESVWGRLGAVVVGVMSSALKWAVEWEDHRTGYYCIVFLLGLVTSSLSKHLNDGNNPAWPIVDQNSGGRQKGVMLIGALALLEFTTRPASSPYHTDSISKPTPEPPEAKKTAQQTWLLRSLALGSLVYSLHERLSDPSTLITWSWEGYPLSGPHPHVHAPLTLLAHSLGLVLVLVLSPSVSSPNTSEPTSRIYLNILSHPLIYLFGLVSTYLLLYHKSWTGYTGGLMHAAFLTVIVPHILQQAGDVASARGAGRVFGVAWLVWIVFLFIGTFTVAYAFVPGAWLFRERTDLVLAAQIALLAPSFHWRSLIPSTNHSSLPTLSPLPRSARKYALTFITAACLAAFAVPMTRPSAPMPTPAPSHARARMFNAGIWTVHFGIDNEGRDSQRRIRNLVRDMELDVVGFLETDLQRPVFGNRDLTRVITEELGYYVDIGPGPNQHTWGCVLLSKFPILESRHHLLPSPDGELAPAIEAILDIYGVNVTVIVAHNGQEETPLDRELQATELARIMSASYPQPVVFLGYVVSKPLASRPAPYEIMVTDGKVHDIDDDDGDRWCEYIFYRGLYRTSYARVSRSTITDTELQIGQFVVPRYGHVVTNDTQEARYLRAWKEDLPVEHWFPQEYYGNKHSGGVRGHYYHVFGTPLYYKIPEDAVL